jgi:hypothetical protein
VFVSRVELQSYSHIGNRAYLAAQTDAAINPGNSGGRLFRTTRWLASHFRNSRSGTPASSITTTLVKHFIQDIEDGKYDGVPSAGVRLVGLQSPAYRRLLKLPDNDLGARVDHIFDGQRRSNCCA